MGYLSRIGLADEDGSRIRAAMELGRTATEQSHRGKGLPDVQRIVEQSEQGLLRILSGRGEYIYSKGESPTILNHRHSIGGTLIQWELQL